MDAAQGASDLDIFEHQTVAMSLFTPAMSSTSDLVCPGQTLIDISCASSGLTWSGSKSGKVLHQDSSDTPKTVRVAATKYGNLAL